MAARRSMPRERANWNSDNRCTDWATPMAVSRVGIIRNSRPIFQFISTIKAVVITRLETTTSSGPIRPIRRILKNNIDNTATRAKVSRGKIEVSRIRVSL